MQIVSSIKSMHSKYYQGGARKFAASSPNEVDIRNHSYHWENAVGKKWF